MTLTERLNNINKSLGTVGENKVDLSTMLLETRASECWAETSYGSWKAFCSKEVALSYSAVYVYLRTAKLARDNNFRITDMKYIVDSIGWERFRIGLSKLDPSDQVNVITFIKKFKDLNLNERVTYGADEEEKKMVTFSFHIPQSVAETLTDELVIRGMRITNKSRTNASAAMVKLVKDLTEQNGE